MSFRGYTKTAVDGDIAIAYTSPDNMTSIHLKSGGTFNNKFGEFKHDDMIGKTWGSQIPNSKKTNSIWLLQPTPEIWTSVLPHRTQILYMPDIALVSSYLELRPGVNVIEAGTGSGSFTHSMVRSVAPLGHVYTFEYHEQRWEQAQQEFKKHGIDEWITASHRDVCKLGFGDKMNGVASAVFLDMPSPWEAIPHTLTAFDRSQPGRICCFSPSIEQVNRTAQALHQYGFVEIRMMETLIRPYSLRVISEKSVPVFRKRVKKDDETEMNKDAEMQTEKETQVEENGEVDEQESSSSSNEMDIDASTSTVRSIHTQTQRLSVKAQKTLNKPLDSLNKPSRGKRSYIELEDPENQFHALTIPKQTRGHTSYLTFATLLPEWNEEMRKRFGDMKNKDVNGGDEDNQEDNNDNEEEDK